MRRGEVYWAEIAPRSGAEGRGARPVIVVSHDGFNATPGWRSAIVVPVSTSARQGTRGPTVVCLPEGCGGLRKGSVALCHQIITLDRRKLTRRLGVLAREDMAAVEQGVLAALDLA